MTRHEQDVSARGQMRKQAAFLNDVTDAASNHTNFVSVKLRSIESNFAAIRFQQADDETEQCRLSAATGPDQHRCFAGLDREIDFMDCGSVAEVLTDT